MGLLFGTIRCSCPVLWAMVKILRWCVQNLGAPTTPLRRTPSPDFPPPPDRPKFRSFFSLSRHNFLSFFLCRFFTRQPECPNVHISGPQPSKTPPKFHEKTPKREKKENWREDGKKSAKLWASPPFGAPPFGAPTIRGPHPSGHQPAFGDPPRDPPPPDSPQFRPFSPLPLPI